MTTTIVLQQAINGVVLGSLDVLVALGLTLIYGVLVQINFAHADFVTLGAFAAYFFMHLVGAGYIISIGVAFLVGAVLGWLINAAIFTPLRRKEKRAVTADCHHRRFSHDAKSDARVVRADPLRF